MPQGKRLLVSFLKDERILLDAHMSEQLGKASLPQSLSADHALFITAPEHIIDRVEPLLISCGNGS